MALTETHVFDSLPSREDALSLKIGAFNPDTFSDADITYSLAGSSNGVEAYVSSDLGIIGATSTIFKVIDEYNEVVYLKNMKSDVTLGGLYELRNPPSFINLVKVELRDAEYEGMQKSPGVMLFKCTFVFLFTLTYSYFSSQTNVPVDAFLTHLIRQPSAAPFISKKLVQYHGISNPSPSFVSRVTQAFTSGSFSSGGVTFGSNKVSIFAKYV